MSISSNPGIRDKIAKLLALAESDNENEAKLALLRARELMAKYKLRPEECEKSETAKVISEEIGITFTAMRDPWVATMSAVIAENYCCRSFRTRQKGRKTNRLGVVGLEDDFAVSKQIILYAYDCVTSYCQREIEREPWESAADYRDKCNAYGWGFVRGLREAFREQQEQHQEWGLVLVIPKAVDDAMERDGMGKRTPFGKDKTNTSTAKYGRIGYSDGVAFDPSGRIKVGEKRAELAGGVE